MRIIKNLDDFLNQNRCDEENAGMVMSAVAIGKFDGIHIGHQALLQCIINKKKEGMRAVVFTFSPSPEEFFKGQMLPAIDTTDEKRNRFEKMGVDILIEYPLTKESASITPEAFMQDILYDKLNAGYVVSGKDLSFGNKGLGNAKMLQEFADKKGFCYEMIDKVCVGGVEVSSTAVRDAVLKGDMRLVSSMLGRDYQIGGEVVHGKALGRTIQMPTINIVPSKQKLLPPSGVYATVTIIDGVPYYGVTNVGCKPTVSNELKIGVETHLFDFCDDVYGKNVITKLVCFIRKEKKFADLEEMVMQIQQDCIRAKACLEADVV